MKKRVITGVDVPPIVEAAEIGELADICIDKSLLPDPIQPAEIGEL